MKSGVWLKIVRQALAVQSLFHVGKEDKHNVSKDRRGFGLLIGESGSWSRLALGLSSLTPRSKRAISRSGPLLFQENMLGTTRCHGRMFLFIDVSCSLFYMLRSLR